MMASDISLRSYDTTVAIERKIQVTTDTSRKVWFRASEAETLKWLIEKIIKSK